MSETKHPDTVATFDHDGQTYEIDDLGRSMPEQKGEYALYCDGKQVGDFMALVEVKGARHLIRMAREILDGDSDAPPPHSGEVTTVSDFCDLVSAAVESAGGIAALERQLTAERGGKDD